MKSVTIATILLTVVGTALFLNCDAEGPAMKSNEHLYILWTNSDPVTAKNMVFHVRG